LFTWNNVTGGYKGYTFDDLDLIWVPDDPGGPTNTVGNAFFYLKSPTGTQTSWIRNFTVQ